jgi:hypothetical protein
MKNFSWKWIVLISLLGSFLWILLSTFSTNLSKDSTYPLFSTYNSNPKGSSIFYQTLSSLPNISTSRSNDPPSLIEPKPNETLFLLGLNYYDFTCSNKSFIDALDQWTKVPCHIIMTMSPNLHNDRFDFHQRSLKQNTNNQQSNYSDYLSNRKNKFPSSLSQWLSVLYTLTEKNYLFQLNTDKTTDDDSKNKEFAPMPLISSLSNQEITPVWQNHCTLVEIPKSNFSWRILATCNHEPAILQTKMNQALITVMSDSTLFSNEWLLKPEALQSILPWLQQTSHFHFVEARPSNTEPTFSIISLIYKYNIHGILVGLILLFFLLIWASSSAGLSSSQTFELSSSANIKGKSNQDALFQMILRGIPTSQLLVHCIQQYQKFASKNKPTIPSNLSSQAPNLKSEDDIIQLYHQITQHLNKK